jgi:hypothetical protein
LDIGSGLVQHFCRPRANSSLWLIWGQVGSILTVALYLWLAFQSCRFLVEARRSGLLELLLVTPLGSQTIVDGQWRALLRALGLPILLLLLAQVGATLMAQNTTAAMMSGGALTGLNAIWGVVLVLLQGLLAAASTLANLAALVWVGMWLGLKHHKSSLAALKTLAFVQLLPWLGISLVSTLLAVAVLFGRVVATQSATITISFPLVIAGISAGLTLTKDFVFILWARKKLRNSFREEATRWTRVANYSLPGQVPVAIPPVLPGGLGS